MESNSEASCISDPNFAVICAFLERFAASCGITYPSFLDLQEMLECINEVPQELIDLHIILLRKARKAVFREKWEKALIKFCHSYSTQDGWEIERFGYKNSRLEVKLRVLKCLLEGQFDLNSKFKTTINTLESNELRSKPLGKDKLGRIYWLQIDPTSNIRVYREDLDEESWNLVARDRDSLVQLLQELSGDEVAIDLNLLNEDSSVSVEIEKNVLDTGQENYISDTENILSNSEAQLEEKDPLEVKAVDNVTCDVKDEESQSNVLAENGKRPCDDDDDDDDDRELKKVKMDDSVSEVNGVDSVNGVEVGEAIEEPVIHIYGVGSGAECNAGNPDKDEDKSDGGNSSNATEKVEPITPEPVNSEAKKVDSDVKPPPKLWSIDTICGTGSVNHSGDNDSSLKNVKSNQKNFSSFSIESVLEKKADAVCSSSLVLEPSIISLNPISVNNAQTGFAVKNINQVNEQVVNANVKDSNPKESESTLSNPGIEEIHFDPPIRISEKENSEQNLDISQGACAADQVLTTQEDELGEPTWNSDNSGGIVVEKAIQDNAQFDVVRESLSENSNEISSFDGANTSSAEVTKEIDDGKSTGIGKVDQLHNVWSDLNADETKCESIRLLSNDRNLDKKSADSVEVSSIDVPSELTSTETPSGEPVLEENGHDRSNAEISKLSEKYSDEIRRGNDEGLEVKPEEAIISELPEEKTTDGNEKLSEIVVKEADDSTVVDGSEASTNFNLEESSDLNTNEKDRSSIVGEAGETEYTGNGEKVIDGGDFERDTQFEKAQASVSEEARLLADREFRGEEPHREKLETEVTSNSEYSLTREALEQNQVPGKDEAVDAIILENAVKQEKSESLTSVEVLDEENSISVREDIKVEPNNDLALIASSGADVHEKEEIPVEETCPENQELKCEVETKEELPVIDVRNESIKEEEEDEEKALMDSCENRAAETESKEEVEKSSEKGESAEISTKDDDNDKETEKESATVPSGEITSFENVLGDNTSGECEQKEAEEVGERIAGNLKENVGESEASSGEVNFEAIRRKENVEVTDDETDNVAEDEAVGKEVEKDEPELAVNSEEVLKKDEDEVFEKKEEPKTQDHNLKQSAEEASPAFEVKDPLALDDSGPPTPGNEAPAKKAQKRRNSNINSISDENLAPAQEEGVKVGGKRIKRRKKRSKLRKKVSEKREEDKSSDEEKPKDDEATEVDGEKKSPKTKLKEPRARQLIPQREIKHLGISNMEELPSIRQSRRIAQLKLKEEAERNRLKKLEEESKEEEEKRKKKKKKKGLKSGKKRKADGESEYENDEDEGSDAKEQDDKVAKKRKKKDKLVFDELNPWISSSGSSSADEEEEEIEEDAHEEEEMLFKSDHEFSPESDIEDPDYKPIKRARTAKVDSKDQPETGSKYDDTACEKCGEKDHPEWILLCDTCDKGWHASCVRPALMVVPEGDWFCPPCEHTSLIQKLRESLVDYDKCQKQRENEELRKKRLAFVGISLDNVLPSKKDKKPKAVEGGFDKEGESEETASENASAADDDNDDDDDSSSSGSDSSSDSSNSGESSEPVYQLRERRSNITSYRYNEYDELIKSALQDEMEAVKEEFDAEDANNQDGDDDVDEKAVEGETGRVQNDVATLGAQLEPGQVPLELPKDIAEAKPRIRPKKKEVDRDYVAESDEEDEDEYNVEDEDLEDEEEEEEVEEDELVDEVPPVVPRYDKKKKKSRSLNVRSLDFTSDEEEEDNSDSDFKGGSSEEESEFSLPSESESSDGIRKKKRGYDGPVRRSTRARTARYDREFINDDSDDDAPRRKKSRNLWATSESSDSDRSWGKRKRKSNKSGYRSAVPKKKSKPKARKRSKKKAGDSDNEYKERSKKSSNRKVQFGGLETQEEEQVVTRRTRGKKINYQEMNASDSDEEVVKRRPRLTGDSDEEFVAEKEKSDDTEGDRPNDQFKGETNGRAVSKKSILLKMKKKKRHVIPDPDDFSEDDLLEDQELDQFAEELGDLDDEEERILGEMLNDGDVPIHELKTSLRKLKERRREKGGNAEEIQKSYPAIMENPGLASGFPKIGNIKMAPARPEPVPQLGMPPDALAAAAARSAPNLFLKRPEDEPNMTETALLLQSEQKTDGKESLMGLQPPPYPAFVPDVPPGVIPPLNPSQSAFPMATRPPIPPYNSFQGMITPHLRMPPEYQHSNIPTTVLGLNNDLNDARKLPRKPASNTKLKSDGTVSPVPESSEENSGDGRLPAGDITPQDSPPKRRGRGRGKKQLMAEAQAKQELGISTVQAPTQFPAQGLPPDGGSVITRMLNTPQGPQSFLDFPIAGRGRPPFRPPFPNAIRAPINAAPPSPSRLRAPGPSIFHPTLDPSSAPGAAANLPQGKPPQPAFARPPTLARFPTDAAIRPPFPGSPTRNESYPYPNFFGAYPLPNSDEFHNPGFPVHPFDDQPLDGSAPGKPFEDESGGEFGGLASYFASQREDDLDT